MAITRRQRKEISLGSSRHLRSRVVPYPQPAQKNARHLPLPPVPDRVISTNRHPQPQAVEIDEEPNLHVLLGCEETGEPVRTQTGVGDVPEGSTSFHNILPSQINQEHVGVPNDGKWDHIAAHESRFCFEHEENEWLLESEYRWMRPSDFNIPGAEAALEAKLAKYNSGPWNLNRHRHASQAECNGNLWSHIDTPLQKGELGDAVIYLIRWKLCWTLESHIDDMGWVRSSFKAQNERIQRRRSARVEETAPNRAAMRKSMMVVVKLEHWLRE